MRKIALALSLVCLSVPFAHAATKDVRLGDNFFKPKKVTIAKGDRVTWKWKGNDVHNVAIKKPGKKRIAKASPFKTDGKFSYRFRRLGKWRILCETHPKAMRMRVIVKAPE